MSGRKTDTALMVAPYVAWMALMLGLPAVGVPDGPGYAIRAGVSAALLTAAAWRFRFWRGLRPADLVYGVAAGIAMTILWIVPEYSEFYRRFLVIGDVPSPAAPQTSPYDPAVCGWAVTIARLAGSAFVIAPAEEMFFRSFLYRRLQAAEWRDDSLRRRFDMSAFLWTVALFSLEHNRLAAAAAAAAVYGFVYIKRGLPAAIAAHAATNFLLALYILVFDAWSFW